MAGGLRGSARGQRPGICLLIPRGIRPPGARPSTQTATGLTMAGKMMHLGWFCNFMPGEWDHPFAAGWPPWDGKFHVEIAQAMERACFDYIMLEDTLMVSEAYGGSAVATLKHALLAPKHDPAPLATLIAAGTSRMGVVATLSTMAYPPFMLARLCSTLDHIAGGRFGWNIVTTGEETAARNFGLQGPPGREQR